jgi:hypothetical protein
MASVLTEPIERYEVDFVREAWAQEDEENPKEVVSMATPNGFMWCFNLIRRGQFAMRELIRLQEDALALEVLEGMMLVQDYILLTTSLEEGYSLPEWNERIEKQIQRIQLGVWLAKLMWEEKEREEEQSRGEE